MSNKVSFKLPARFADTEWSPPLRDAEEAALSLAPPEVVIAVVGRVLSPERAARLDAVAAARLFGIALVLEDLYDPHNGGAALRSCESVGLSEVHVIERRERFRVARKITQGCDRWLDIHHHSQPGACADLLHRRGFRIYAAVPGAATPLEALDPGVPAAFAIGNEHAGLSDELRAACDLEFAIPLHGFSRSVNLSVAAALCLYTHATRRRQALGRPTDLSVEEALRLRARYYARDVPRAAALLRHHLGASRRPGP